MSQGFDTIVRPSVLPNIRPPARPRLRPSVQSAVHALSTADPTSGQAAVVLTGSSPQLVKTSISGSNSWSRQIQKEQQRTVTTQRVYQKDKDGKVNKENYVDVEETTEMKMKNADGTNTKVTYAPPQEADNIEIIERDTVKVNPEAVEGGSAAP